MQMKVWTMTFPWSLLEVLCAEHPVAALSCKGLHWKACCMRPRLVASGPLERERATAHTSFS